MVFEGFPSFHKGVQAYLVFGNSLCVHETFPTMYIMPSASVLFQKATRDARKIFGPKARNQSTLRD